MKIRVITLVFFIASTLLVTAFSPKANFVDDDPLPTDQTDPCLVNALYYETNATDWVLTATNTSYPLGSAPYAYNGASTFSWWWDTYSPGKWISPLSGQPIHTSCGMFNEEVTYTYKFRCCKNDVITVLGKVHRDNFCVVKVNGTTVLQDSIAPPTNQSNFQVGNIFTTTFNAAADSVYSIDFTIIEYDVPGYSQNGWGGKMSGYISSTTGTNSIVNATSSCASYVCPPPASVDNTVREASIKVYPNPATNLLNVSGNLDGDYDYVITTITGAVVKKGILPSSRLIDIASLADNTYMLKLSNEQGTTTVKFMKR